MTDEEAMQKEIIGNLGELLAVQPSLNNFKQMLAGLLNQLINTDFNRLITLLYRLDISEKKLKQSLATAAGKEAGSIIADMIIERQLQKIQSRKHFAKRNDNIADEDKW